MVMEENNLYWVTSSEKVNVFETAFWCMLGEVSLKPSLCLITLYLRYAVETNTKGI